MLPSKTKLTDRGVAAYKLPEGVNDHIVWDTMQGFGYRLRRATGGSVSLTWVAQYRVGRATRRMTLGKASVLPVAGARKKAKAALGDVAKGKDPQAEKLAESGKVRHSFKATVKDYLDLIKNDVRERTLTAKSRYLTDARYFGPLHKLALDQITRKDVAIALNRITLERGPIVAAMARAQLSALFTWALTQGLTEANPVIGTKNPEGGKPRSRVLSDSELARIWQACDDDEHSKCIKLLILTGARRQEIGGLAWSEINFEDSTWTLPEERAKNHHAHTLPLMPAMLDIIKTVPRMASRDLLFGTRSLGFVAWSRGKKVLDERSGVGEWTVHDIRRTVATRMADLGIMPHVIEQILNHQSGHRSGVAGTYNRSSYEREVRAALATWHDHLDALITGRKRKVISMHQAAS